MDTVWQRVEGTKSSRTQRWRTSRPGLAVPAGGSPGQQRLPGVSLMDLPGWLLELQSLQMPHTHLPRGIW